MRLTEEGADIIDIDIDITVIRDMGRRPSARKSIQLRLGGIRNAVTGLRRLETVLRAGPRGERI